MSADSSKPAKNRYRISPHIGSTLIFWRTVRRMRQKDLADASGVSLSTIKWIERGQRKRGPRVDTLEALCEALDITVLDLLAGALRRALWGDNTVVA